jgi:hypothetical protein
MTGTSVLLDEFNYYKAHQDEIVAGHLDEIAVIKDHEVKGYYKEWKEAFSSCRGYPLGSFMVTDCKPKGTDIVKFHNSTITFAKTE